jgi:hypothetical protein
MDVNQTKNGGSPHSPNQKGSLNYINKKREAARIDRENEKIMRSLLS